MVAFTDVVENHTPYSVPVFLLDAAWSLCPHTVLRTLWDSATSMLHPAAS